MNWPAFHFSTSQILGLNSLGENGQLRWKQGLSFPLRPSRGLLQVWEHSLNTLRILPHLWYNQHALEPLMNWSEFQYKPNLSGQLVEREWSVEARPTIPTQTQQRLVVGMGTLWKHSWATEEPLVQSKCARTNHELASISVQAKSQGLILWGRMVS